MTTIVWFKWTDLRLTDNQPFAVAHGYSQPDEEYKSYRTNKANAKINTKGIQNVIHLFCFDPRFYGHAKTPYGFPKTGIFRARFLMEAVADLRNNLRARNSDLVIRFGKPEDILPELVKQYNATSICTYDEWAWDEINIQNSVESKLKTLNAPVLNNWGGTIVHLNDLPFTIGNCPDIYSQFRVKVENNWEIRSPDTYTIPQSFKLKPLPSGIDVGDMPTLEQLGYDAAQQSQVLDSRAVLPFKGGETAGIKRVKEYLWEKDLLKTYKETRNGLLGGDYSSKFSPWLAIGCLSGPMIYKEVQEYEKKVVANESTYWLVFELLWRDFFRFTSIKYGNRIFLKYGPKGKHAALKPDPREVAPGWSTNKNRVQAWIDGTTGHPFVDANMRELKLSGWMSNRGRQNVASFFTKDLGIDWRIGAEWFESQLLDYDVGSNWGNWNYVAGVGADPREGRYFNIEKQQKNYDPSKKFIFYWLDEFKQQGTSGYPTTPIVPLIFGYSGNSSGRDGKSVGHARGGRGGQYYDKNNNQSGKSQRGNKQVNATRDLNNGEQLVVSQPIVNSLTSASTLLSSSSFTPPHLTNNNDFPSLGKQRSPISSANNNRPVANKLSTSNNSSRVSAEWNHNDSIQSSNSGWGGYRK